MKKPIYLDNAATTATRPEVLEAMLPYFCEFYGNPSTVYSLGASSKQAEEHARESIGISLNAPAQDIYFTAGGSESDNWALKAAAEAYAGKGRHIITSKIEHHAILHTCQYLEERGFEVTYLDVDEYGMVSPAAVEAAIRPDTILVSIMFANNEIGTIEPIAEIGKIAHKHGVIFHTDAVQAAGHLHINVKEQNIDMLSLSGHKFHGPKGVGVLYARQGIPLTNIIEGGAQERGKRAGTENIPGIMGLAAALEESCGHIDEDTARLTKLRDKLIAGLSKIPHSALNGDPVHRLPTNVNFCFEGIEGESLLLLLDQAGICASSGSACTSGSLDPSHVLLAIGRPHEVAHGSLRLSLCHDTTEEQVDYILEKVPGIVAYLRDMSPMWKDLESGKRTFIL